MEDKKVKIYKNPHRNEKETYIKYVPQYQVMGIDPEEIRSSVVPANTTVANSPSLESNPRFGRTVNQPYAEIGNSFEMGSVPNVGNNMEHTWSGVDGQIIDDISGENVDLPPDHPMIDNNNFIEEDAPSSNEDYNKDDVIPILHDLKYNSYLLLVNGSPICSGPLSEIEDQVKALIFGEHELCNGISIPEEDLIVIKRVPIKIGVFLE